jgi:hypothetical protein
MSKKTEYKSDRILSGKEQAAALLKIPDCVEVDGMDGTWEHVIFRVENVVFFYIKGGFYTTNEAASCRAWLRKYAPRSIWARVKFK